jgi:hypothetical protein
METVLRINFFFFYCEPCLTKSLKFEFGLYMKQKELRSTGCSVSP